ncbi:MAG: ATP-binding protein, partial [Pseudomonadota bacterium]
AERKQVVDQPLHPLRLAAHDAQESLSSVLGFIETLQGPARDDAEAQERFLGIMRSQAERMERLVNDLLSLSRIELNEHIAPSSFEDFGEIAKETAEAMSPLARRRGVAVEVQLDGSGPVVRGDRDQLSQAVGNLIENALKYGGGKPVRLVRRGESEAYPGLVGIGVEDQGEGLSRDDAPRVTERFYRVSIKRSRDQGGTGLGLAIVKHILSRHRGELEIESAPGEGSRFTLWLPPARSRAEGDAAETAETASADAPAVASPGAVAAAARDLAAPQHPAGSKELS